MIALYNRAVDWIGGRIPEGLMLLAVRIALGGVFWRSARTKVEEGTTLTISETTYFLFQEEYAGVPLPPEFAAPLAFYAEHLFPALLFVGLLSRVSAVALLVMTLVIQVFVYPDAWWPVHSLWVAMAAVIIVRGPGIFSLDHLLAGRRR